jgi:hypothetical protein
MYVCVGAAAAAATADVAAVAAREDRGNPVGVTCLTFTKEAEKKYASCTSPMIKRVICRSSTYNIVSVTLGENPRLAELISE